MKNAQIVNVKLEIEYDYVYDEESSDEWDYYIINKITDEEYNASYSNDISNIQIFKCK